MKKRPSIAKIVFGHAAILVLQAMILIGVPFSITCKSLCDLFICLEYFEIGKCEIEGKKEMEEVVVVGSSTAHAMVVSMHETKPKKKAAVCQPLF